MGQGDIRILDPVTLEVRERYSIGEWEAGRKHRGRRTHMGSCAVTGHKCYDTEATAWAMIAVTKRRAQPYPCRDCQAWHLRSVKTRRPKRAAAA